MLAGANCGLARLPPCTPGPWPSFECYQSHTRGLSVGEAQASDVKPLIVKSGLSRAKPTGYDDCYRPEADVPTSMQDIEIFIDRLEDGIVVGTNNGADVPVGTVFKVVEKSRCEGDAPEFKTVELGTVVQVELRLSEVIVFRKSIEVMPHGYSAGLRLDGDGLDALRRAVKEKERREFVWLRIQPKAPTSDHTASA